MVSLVEDLPNALFWLSAIALIAVVFLVWAEVRSGKRMHSKDQRQEK